MAIKSEVHQRSVATHEGASKRLLLSTYGKQLFRAVTSVGTNLAERQSSYEGKEFARYVGISLRSAMEVDYWFATLQNLLDHPGAFNEIEAKNLEVIKMLRGLRKSLSSEN